MPSLFKVSALMALTLSAFASAQNVTSTSSPVAGWTYIGCESSASNFAGYVKAETSTSMTIERCIADCAMYQYAGLGGSTCYCANGLGDAATVSNSQCHTMCPGKSTEICGGSSGMKRQVIGGTLLSVYGKLAIVPVGVVYTSVIIKVYVDINIQVGAYTTRTYSSTVTLTGCGCPTPVIPTIPVVTTTVLCQVCAATGGPTTVTVTVPAGVTPGVYTQTISSPVLYTGAASHVGAGSVGGIVAFVGAGLALL